MIPQIISRIKNLLAAVVFVQLFFCASAVEKRTSTLDISKPSPLMEMRETDSITFFWNAPPPDLDSVKSYKLFYRTESALDWSLLKDSIPPAVSPEAVIHRRDLPSTDSIFFFGVHYATKGGALSQDHYSTDSTTSPPGGWYMFWKPK